MRVLKVTLALFMKSDDFWAGDRMNLRAQNRLKAVWWQLKRVGPKGVFLTCQWRQSVAQKM